MVFCEEENKVISGGLDGHIMIWDLLSEEVQSMYNLFKSANRPIQAQSLKSRLHR